MRQIFVSFEMFLAVSVIVLVSVGTYNVYDINTSSFVYGAPDSPSAGAAAKFDSSFYDTVQTLVKQESYNDRLRSVVHYYDVVLTVARYDAHGNDISAEQKEIVVEKLNEIGARNIVAGKNLLFVLASIPVGTILDFSLHDEVYGLGDGQIRGNLTINTSRMTVNAEQDDLLEPDGTMLDVSDVIVAVIDSGITHPTVNEAVIGRATCPSDSPCYETDSVYGAPDSGTTHGSMVAHVIGGRNHTSGLGIASGVSLLDAHFIDLNISFLYSALDWAISKEADVANISISYGLCDDGSSTDNLIVNDAVNQGIVITKSAGNYGSFGYILSPGCASNLLTVGGINDRGTKISMYGQSSRGPYYSNGHPILKPDIVAPASKINLIHNDDKTKTRPVSGTSFSSPHVAAAAAMLIGKDETMQANEVKAALLLGANWTGPIPCTSVQYERYTSGDNCSHARQPNKYSVANGHSSLKILNNVGFGILDVRRSLEYISQEGSSHVIAGNISNGEIIRYAFNITDTAEPVKTLLTWMKHSPAIRDFNTISISDTSYPSNLDLVVICPGIGVMDAGSDYQNNEFAVFMPNQTGTCIVDVTASSIDLHVTSQEYVIASTHPLVPVNIAPIITSIERFDPESEVTSSQSLLFRANFNYPVTGVDLDDFMLSPDSTMESKQFTQTREVLLPIPDEGAAIYDTIAVADSGDILSVSVDVDITHTHIGNLMVDLLAPDGTIVNLHERTGGGSDDINQTYEPAFDGAGLAGDWVLRVRDMSDQEIGTLNEWTLTIEYKESIDVVVGLTGSGSQYFVSVLALRDGTYNLDIVSDSGIIYVAGNPLNGTDLADSDHSYVVETGSPEVVSIKRSDQIIRPANYHSLVFGVNFSEPVRGVDAADFVLSPDDGRALRNFTQTMTPSLPIPDNGAAVFDAVTISSSGTVRSVSVDVDISHTYISDLSVALIAPDGTIALLHNRAGANSHDIHQTYTPNLADISLKGNWTLRMNDAGPADTGTLNEWTLSIKYDEADSTLTGSGSRYLVTVPAAQSGTYNLDIVPNNGISDLAGNPLAGDDPPVDQSFQVEITDYVPITVDAGLDQTVMGGQMVALNGTAAAIDGDPLTYLWTHNSTLAIQFTNSTSPSTTFTAPYVSSNTTLTLTLTADDGTAEVSDSVDILIMPTQNVHPVLDVILEQAVDEMSTLIFVARATDEDLPSDTLTYGLEDPPAGASMDPATGAFTWTPTEDQNGIRTVTVTVSDGRGGTDSQDVKVTVNEVNMPPTLDIIPAQTIDELAMLTFTVNASDDDLHPGVGIEVVAGKLKIPWSIDWTPDWTALFTERGGDLRIIRDGILLPDPIFSVDVIDDAEGGLLGIAVDPEFEENQYIYMYQTYKTDGTTLNKVVRYTLANVTVSEDLVLVDGIPGASYHDGGRIQFGPDGNLYITTGDAGNPSLAQDLDSLAGKILRITREGAIPQDNPFSNSAVWSWGHRNPQGMDWDGSGNLIATEHGPSGERGEAHDEINLILPGANYGWPETVGDESMAGMQDPLLHTGSETWAPSGSEFYDGDMIPGWTGKYFVANLLGEHLRMIDLDLSNNGTHSHEGLFEGQFGRLRDVQTGPDGFLYLLTSNRDGRGSPVSDDDRILKIVPVFDSALSRPANVLTYGLEASPAGASMDPATGTFTWRPAEDQNGIHTITVTVSDGNGGTNSQEVQVTVNEVNVAPIVDAGSDQTALEGQTVMLNGTATDADGDSLTYLWSHNSSLAIQLANSTSPSTTFAAPAVDADTAVTFTLTVDDGTTTATDSFEVTVTDIQILNSPPVADAGSDQTALEGQTVMLNGTATDADGDSLTYLWSHNSSLAIQLANSTSPSTTFAAPAVDADTEITFTLTVNDGLTDSTDTVLVTVNDVPDDSDFVTTWETVLPGESITIPARGTYTIDWGDGTVDARVTRDQTHTYADPGNHTVRISKDITGIYLNNHADAPNLRSIDQWGDAEWRSIYSSFMGASNMVLHATDAPDLSRVTNTSYMFLNASSFDGDLSAWDLSHVASMTGMFWGASSFDGDISSWNVSAVTNMNSMFQYASTFNGDISSWNVSAVTDMNYMFSDASTFNGDISDWDVSAVTDMHRMFHSAFKFNQPLNSWNVSSVTNMSYMFLHASEFNQPLNSWNVSAVTDIPSMFFGASVFNGDISDWDVSAVTDMRRMFHSAFKFNQPLNSWNVSSVTNMSDMFLNADDFEQNLGKWYVVPEDTDYDAATETTLVVTAIATQNFFLNGHSPNYGIGTGGNSTLFSMPGSNLTFKDTTPSAGAYTVNVTASGSSVFERGNNWRTLTVTVTGQEDRPLSVDAGPDQMVLDESTVTLSGTVSDSTNPTYLWTQNPGSPAVTLAGPDTLMPTFTAPDVSSDVDLVFTLTVDDGTDTVTDTVTVTVHDAEADFVTTWSDIDIGINLPIRSSAGSFTVDWGDGKISEYAAIATDSNLHHNYDTSGTYTIRISGNFSGIYLHGNSDTAGKLQSIDQWGDIEWTTMAGAFYFASNMIYNATDVPDLSSVTDMSYMFYTAGFSSGDLSGWNVSAVTDMSYMFSGASSFNGYISSWNVSAVTNMNSMFDGASSFEQNLGNWYIMLDNASVTGILQTVGNITTQNEFLATQGPTYGIGSSSDSEHFGINGTALVLTTIPDANPALVNITSTGDFGTSNSRIFEITFSSGVVDTTNPRLESIERYSPASQNTNSQSLIYEATFSESVTGVTSSDFILSPDSTGGGTTTTTSAEQFTQTRSPNLAIPDLQTVSDTITVSDSGTVTSVSVAVDITHTYIGDLKIDLIAPDGTTKILHNRSDGSDDDIVKTYTPNFDGVSIAGVWTLQINDNYNADPGTLNSWTLTINHGSTATTVNPVTGVSGSDDTYYVTVSSSTDGTYNLDLVSSGHSIADSAGNSMINTAPTGADQTYTVSITVTDTANPRLASIERYSPASQNTDSQTLVYKATFSESVTGVTASDFVLSPDSTGGINSVNPVTDISGSGDTYYVTVSSSTDGTYNLDLVSSGHSIADSAGNSMINTAPTGADQTYTVSITVTDTANPRLASIERYSPASQNTDSQTLVYKATFSESVTGVTASDFVLSPDSTGGINGVNPVTDISGSGDAYYVTVSATQDGTYNLDLVSSGHGIEDAASNSLTNVSPTGADETYTVSTTVADNTNPRLESIERHTPATANTDSQTLVYKATFSEDVAGVTASDFTLSPDSAGGENTTASTGQFTQTRSPNLDIPDLATVSDTITVPDSETATSVLVEVDITHDYINDLKIDIIAPDGTSITLHNNSGGNANNIDKSYAPQFGSIPISGVWTLQIHDNYNADPGVLNSWTLTINYGDTATTLSSVTDISGSGDAYYVTVSATQDGTYNLDLVSSGHGIEDAASNSLTNVSPTGADETYTVSTTVADNTNPRLESIERHTPATANTDSQTLVYKATFSEDVAGVTASDFTLSPDSAGGENTTASTGQFTQTRSPNLDIPDLATVSDTITVPDSETATSVLVEVDITHDYINDLKIDIIAPDGTSITLHNNSGGNANNIDKSYAPQFGSIPISGVWTLQIHDNYNADPGVLNSWTLTINYGDTATTLSSVTDISGSGDAYYVTVSATQDGTYNLDLVSSGHGIEDAASNSLTNVSPTGADETYTVSTTVADNTNPRLESIERHTPATANTDSQTLVYKATFSEDVAGVTASDFTLSPDSAGGENTTASTGQFTQTRSPNLDIPDLATVSDTITVPDSETATSVLVEVDITHDYINDLKIDIIAPDGTSITLHNNSGGNANNIDKSYAPQFGSIPISGVWTLQIHDNYNADPGVLNSWTLTINYGDTATTLSSVTDISGSGDAYYVTVSATQDGTYNLDLVSSGHGIEDAASNSLTNVSPTGADETYTVSTTVADNTNPRLESIERHTPATANTDSQTLVYKATFSEDVAGVTASDFTLSPDSAGGENTTASTGQFTQTRSPNLDIPDLATVSDTITVPDSETATSVLVEVDITHDYINDLKIDIIAPDGTSITLHNNSGGNANNIDKSYAPQFGSIPISGVWTLQIHDNYNADPGVLNSWTLTINYGDTATTLSSVTDISGSGDAYYVTVSATQDGTYNLDLVSSGHGIEDAASNSLTNVSPTGADETYTVSTTVADNTNPRLESIERHTPATANTDSQTLVYKATFSEDVAGVTASDFTLSPDSAGGENTTASTGQFTQTRSPNLDIPDLATVSDTITVPDSETATSVLVEVDITHDYINDLKIDIIAPDGTSITLHNNSGGNANNIDKSYAPQFGSIPISGVWTLQIHDNYNADPGVLNSWTLTINYGDTATTLSSVTDISGSGDAYYVTVSATQDGTYNLDLVSSGHGIEDAASNSLTNVSPTGADETYTVSTTVADNTNPRLESIERHTPATANTDSQTLVYKATFSEDVAGVTASDFTLSPDSAGGENTTASTGQFTQTRSPNLDIPDLATVSDTITVPDSETATSVLVEVDITHDYINDLKIDIIAPDGTSITLHNNSGGNANNIDKSYAPQFGSIPISGVWTLQIHDNYNADPGVLNSWTLTINYGDTATTLSSVTDISGSGDAYYVTVSATQDGTYNLDLVSSGHGIEDAASNSLTNVSPTGADETYTVSTTVADNTNPRLESIERHTPATANTDSQTLVYKATFSEDVAGVTASDFTLSPDSAGGENTTASTGQFTQTRSPNLDIPDLATVSDTITVPDSETATSVLVEVDITHDYINDLKIDIIAPDGTSITLHNNSGGNANNIDKSYAPQFGSIPISGVWTLQIHDNYNADPGVLNSWTLTINYGDTATTLSSVTDISGSGDAYYVTVSATQDGTYNLDLVSSGHGIEDAASNSLTNTTPTETDETYTVTAN